MKSFIALLVCGTVFCSFAVDMQKIDASKEHFLTGTIYNAGTAEVRVLVGVVPCDKDKQRIQCSEINTIPETETKLIAPCKVGDTFIWVADGSNWRSDSKIFHVAFDVLPNQGDLPNRKLAGMVESVKKEGNGYRINLSKPVGYDRPAGTMVREHASGNRCLYPIIRKLAAGEKYTINERLDKWYGVASRHNFWKGTEFIYIEVTPRSLKIENLKLAPKKSGKKNLFVD